MVTPALRRTHAPPRHSLWHHTRRKTQTRVQPRALRPTHPLRRLWQRHRRRRPCAILHRTNRPPTRCLSGYYVIVLTDVVIDQFYDQRLRRRDCVSNCRSDDATLQPWPPRGIPPCRLWSQRKFPHSFQLPNPSYSNQHDVL